MTQNLIRAVGLFAGRPATSQRSGKNWGWEKCKCIIITDKSQNPTFIIPIQVKSMDTSFISIEPTLLVSDVHGWFAGLDSDRSFNAENMKPAERPHSRFALAAWRRTYRSSFLYSVFPSTNLARDHHLRLDQGGKVPKATQIKWQLIIQ